MNSDPASPPHPTTQAAWRAGIFAVLALFVLIGLRLPFLERPLVGEEGMFAYMAVDNGRAAPEPREALLVARVAGRDLWDPPQHPLPPYWFLIHVVRPWLKPAAFDSLSLGQKSVWARLPFLVLFGLALLAWLSLALRRARADPVQEHWKLFLPPLLFVGSAPLMVGGSLQPQMDGSWGVLLVGLAACFLGAAHRATAAGKARAWCCMAGFLAALGKNEWSLAFLAACLAAWTAAVASGAPARSQAPGRRIVLPALAGLAAGSLLSLCLDWANYRDGFLLMLLFGQGSPQPWTTTFAMRWPWIWPLFPMLALAVLVFRGRPRCPALGILFFWGLCLSAGFLATNWTGDFFPRYFCPALFALLCYVTAAGDPAASTPGSDPTLPCSGKPAVKSPWPFFATLLLCAGCALNLISLERMREEGRSSLAGHTDTELAKLARAYEEYHARRDEFRAQGLVPPTNSVYGYYFPDADFTTKQALPAAP